MRKSVFVAAALAVSAAATAKEAPLDPKLAYVLIDIEHLADSMVKGTDMPGEVTLGRYDPVKGDIRGGDLSPETALPNKKQTPHVAIRKGALVKGPAVRQYLVPIEPDVYVVEGASGTAFSLGSVQFQARAGEIIDLGVVRPAVDWAQGEKPISTGKLMTQALFGFGPMGPKNMRPVRLDVRPRTARDLPLPPRLAGKSATPVAFTPGAKFGNYLGGLVNRIGGRAQRARELPLAEQEAAEAEAAAAALEEKRSEAVDAPNPETNQRSQ